MSQLEAKYSPGPWRVTNYWPRKVYDKVNRLVAVPFLPNTGDRTENRNRCGANANLISAAPEMYALLGRLEDYFKNRHIYGYGVEEKVSEDLLSEIKKVMKKVRGDE